MWWDSAIFSPALGKVPGAVRVRRVLRGRGAGWSVADTYTKRYHRVSPHPPSILAAQGCGWLAS